MKSRYILDACALIAYINDEEGADTVESLLVGAIVGDASISMSKINLLEVYYGVLRDFGLAKAEEVLNEILSLPIQIIGNLSDATFREAGRLKATYKISLADSLALGFASVSGDALVTADHHEFDAVEKAETIKFIWIR